MKCDQCGSPLEEDWEYCSECGVTIDFEKIKKEQKSRESETETDSKAEADSKTEADSVVEEVSRIEEVNRIANRIEEISRIEAANRIETANRVEETRVKQERTEKVIRLVSIAALLVVGLAMGLLLGRTGLYIMCFLVVLGVVIAGLVKPPQSLVSRIIFWICAACLVVGTVLVTIYVIAAVVLFVGLLYSCGQCIMELG